MCTLYGMLKTQQRTGNTLKANRPMLAQLLANLLFNYKGERRKMQEQAKRTQKEINAAKRANQRKIMVTLTKPEGEVMDKIIADNGCKNLSQLCKKIIHGEISLY